MQANSSIVNTSALQAVVDDVRIYQKNRITFVAKSEIYVCKSFRALENSLSLPHINFPESITALASCHRRHRRHVFIHVERLRRE